MKNSQYQLFPQQKPQYRAQSQTKPLFPAKQNQRQGSLFNGNVEQLSQIQPSFLKNTSNVNSMILSPSIQYTIPSQVISQVTIPQQIIPNQFVSQYVLPQQIVPIQQSQVQQQIQLNPSDQQKQNLIQNQKQQQQQVQQQQNSIPQQQNQALQLQKQNQIQEQQNYSQVQNQQPAQQQKQISTGTQNSISAYKKELMQEILKPQKNKEKTNEIEQKIHNELLSQSKKGQANHKKSISVSFGQSLGNSNDRISLTNSQIKNEPIYVNQIQSPQFQNSTVQNFNTTTPALFKSQTRFVPIQTSSQIRTIQHQTPLITTLIPQQTLPSSTVVSRRNSQLILSQIQPQQSQICTVYPSPSASVIQNSKLFISPTRTSIIQPNQTLVNSFVRQTPKQNIYNSQIQQQFNKQSGFLFPSNNVQVNTLGAQYDSNIISVKKEKELKTEPASFNKSRINNKSHDFNNSRQQVQEILFQSKFLMQNNIHPQNEQLNSEYYGLKLYEKLGLENIIQIDEQFKQFEMRRFEFNQKIKEFNRSNHQNAQTDQVQNKPFKPSVPDLYLIQQQKAQSNSSNQNNRLETNSGLLVGENVLSGNSYLSQTIQNNNSSQLKQPIQTEYEKSLIMQQQSSSSQPSSSRQNQKQSNVDKKKEKNADSSIKAKQQQNSNKKETNQQLESEEQEYYIQQKNQDRIEKENQHSKSYNPEQDISNTRVSDKPVKQSSNNFQISDVDPEQHSDFKQKLQKSKDSFYQSKSQLSERQNSQSQLTQQQSTNQEQQQSQYQQKQNSNSSDNQDYHENELQQNQQQYQQPEKQKNPSQVQAQQNQNKDLLNKKDEQSNQTLDNKTTTNSSNDNNQSNYEQNDIQQSQQSLQSRRGQEQQGMNQSHSNQSKITNVQGQSQNFSKTKEQFHPQQTSQNNNENDLAQQNHEYLQGHRQSNEQSMQSQENDYEQQFEDEDQEQEYNQEQEQDDQQYQQYENEQEYQFESEEEYLRYLEMQRQQQYENNQNADFDEYYQHQNYQQYQQEGQENQQPQQQYMNPQQNVQMQQRAQQPNQQYQGGEEVINFDFELNESDMKNLKNENPVNNENGQTQQSMQQIQQIQQQFKMSTEEINNLFSHQSSCDLCSTQNQQSFEELNDEDKLVMLRQLQLITEKNKREEEQQKQLQQQEEEELLKISSHSSSGQKQFNQF